MHRPLVRLVPFAPVAPALLLLAQACSSSSASTGTAKDAGHADARVDAHDAGHSSKTHPDAANMPEASVGVSDARPDVIDDPNDCVAVTATSSENGIGGYCSPGAGQCLHAGTGGSATLCSADFGAPAHEWFCTITCNLASDCGAGGGTCIAAPFGQICVPATCTGALGDASSQVFDAFPDQDAPPEDGSAHDAAADGSPRSDASAG